MRACPRLGGKELAGDFRFRLAREFEKTLNARLTDLRGYGVVAFCETAEWGKRLVTRFLLVDDNVTDNATARRLFP
ncbi:MAG TPA: hypothetical protein VFA44_11010 [Gaiellaceae bacterium]|nr:hypothetical protein [Gaiellaceae bacterium]